MGYDPANLPDDVLGFLTERHIATLTTLRADGTPHVCAIAFTYEPADGKVRMICFGTSQKAVNARRGGRAVVAQVDGPRWLALEGPVELTDDPERVAAAVERHAVRYKQPGENPTRVAIEITVDRVLGRASIPQG